MTLEIRPSESLNVPSFATRFDIAAASSAADAAAAEAAAEAASAIALGALDSVFTFDTLADAAAANIPPLIDAIEVRGVNSAGDVDRPMIFVHSQSGDPDTAPGFQDAAGQWWVLAAVTAFRGVNEWFLHWWNPLDHATVDQTALVQQAVDTKVARAEPVTLHFPSGTIALNAGVTDVPVELDGVTDLHFKLLRSSIMKKTAIQRVLIYGGRTVKAERVSFEGGTWDGAGLDDTDNDWPLVFIKQGDDIHYIETYAKDVSSGFRVGYPLALGATSMRPVWQGVVIDNPRYHGIEAFNTDDARIIDPKIYSGAHSSGAGNRAIRILQSQFWQCRGARVKGCGIALALNTDDGRLQSYGILDDFQFLDQTSTASIYSYFPHSRIKLMNGLIRGGGALALIWLGQLEDPGENRSSFWEIYNVTLAANSAETSLLRVYGADGVTVRNCSMQHTGLAMVPNHYAMRFVKCGGLVDVRGNAIRMDGGSGGTHARGVADVEGLSSLKNVVGGNTFNMPLSNQVIQDTSSGTQIKGGTAGDDNTYTVYP